MKLSSSLLVIYRQIVNNGDNTQSASYTAPKRCLERFEASKTTRAAAWLPRWTRVIQRIQEKLTSVNKLTPGQSLMNNSNTK